MKPLMGLVGNGLGRCGCNSLQEERKNLLFLKKKKQKDFCFLEAAIESQRGDSDEAAQEIKVFLLLFLQKKKTLPP